MPANSLFYPAFSFKSGYADGSVKSAVEAAAACRARQARQLMWIQCGSGMVSFDNIK